MLPVQITTTPNSTACHVFGGTLPGKQSAFTPRQFYLLLITADEDSASIWLASTVTHADLQLRV